MTGSNDGVINIWSMNVGQWRSHREANFNLGDKQRLLLTINQSGCQVQKQIKYRDINNVEQTEFEMENVTPYDLNFDYSKATETTRFACDAVKWSINGRFAIASI